MFWLSHHRPSEYHRTLSLGPLRLCARCLGTYPVLVVCLAVQLALPTPLASALDPYLALLLPLPALADWAVGQFRPFAGSNPLRFGTGVLLGVSLARTLFVHLHRPFHSWLVLQAALVTAVALPVILATYLGRRGR